MPTLCFFSTNNPYCFVRSSVLNYYPKIYNNGFCTHCHKEGPEDKFHLVEYSEFHFDYELAPTQRTKIGELYILLNWNSYYSKFISLKSNTIHNLIRENDYRNYLD